MKKLLSAYLLLCISCSGLAQNNLTEFSVNDNGLIYTDSTIQQLKHIIDSLNLKHKVCDLNKVYYAIPQTMAHYIYIKGEDAEKARKDMDNQISFEALSGMYNNATIEKDLLVVRDHYEYDQKTVTRFSSPTLNDKYEHTIRFEENAANYRHPLKGKWLYNSYNKNQSTEELRAFYIIDGFEMPALPEQYARMIQYTDCLIDTTTDIFYKASSNKSRKNKDVEAFYEYISKHTDTEPVYNKKNSRRFTHLHNNWMLKRNAVIREELSKDTVFHGLLARAVDEALETGYSSADLELLAELYYSKKAALNLKRQRRVVGMCSADKSPRIHAFEIACLSAEAVNWETFLRAHLNIMNDRFDRISDGSYAWGKRATYIRELEVLDINVKDLLLGISLRVDNVAGLHYFGNVSRIGRALSESKEAADFETSMLSMVEDNQLDLYNRLIAYYLFLNYSYYQSDKQQQSALLTRLNASVKTFPAVLANRAAVNIHRWDK